VGVNQQLEDFLELIFWKDAAGEPVCAAENSRQLPKR
jgi:hypothetical protein